MENQSFNFYLSPLQSQQLLQKLKTLASIKTSVGFLLIFINNNIMFIIIKAEQAVWYFVSFYENTHKQEAGRQY